MTVEEVLEHHLKAFLAGDVEMTMEDYANDCALITPDATMHGKDEVAAFFGEIFGGLFESGTYEQTIIRKDVVGDIAYIAWRSTGEACDVPLATDTFLIRDGKIEVQTFAGKIDVK